MDTPEFSRIYDVRHLPAAPQALSASEAECAALAKRFGLVAVKRLEAQAVLIAEGRQVTATGRISADIIQSCAVSGEDLPAKIDEPLALRFVPDGPAAAPDEEIELSEDALDEIPYDGTQVDLGEAGAQGMVLAIDPYAVGPEAERVRQNAKLMGEAAAGPFAALAKLKKN